VASTPGAPPFSAVAATTITRPMALLHREKRPWSEAVWAAAWQYAEVPTWLKERGCRGSEAPPEAGAGAPAAGVKANAAGAGVGAGVGARAARA